jgi:DNA-damage-inducible protein J
MSANALVQTRIDAEVKARATAVLDRMGLTASDVVRILLTRVENKGALPAGFLPDSATHDAWFRAKVMEGLDDTRQAVPSDDVEAHFARRRAAALARAFDGDA